MTTVGGDEELSSLGAGQTLYQALHVRVAQMVLGLFEQQGV